MCGFAFQIGGAIDETFLIESRKCSCLEDIDFDNSETALLSGISLFRDSASVSASLNFMRVLYRLSIFTQYVFCDGWEHFCCVLWKKGSHIAVEL